MAPTHSRAAHPAPCAPLGHPLSMSSLSPYPLTALPSLPLSPPCHYPVTTLSLPCHCPLTCHWDTSNDTTHTTLLAHSPTLTRPYSHPYSLTLTHSPLLTVTPTHPFPLKHGARKAPWNTKRRESPSTHKIPLATPLLSGTRGAVRGGCTRVCCERGGARCDERGSAMRGGRGTSKDCFAILR